MLAVLMIAYHVLPGVGLLLLPVWLYASALILAVGIGLYASALMVSDRAACQPGRVRAFRGSATMETVLRTEPAAGLAGRLPLVAARTGTLDVNSVLYAAVVSTLVFVGGAFAFKRMERKFADVIEASCLRARGRWFKSKQAYLLCIEHRIKVLENLRYYELTQLNLRQHLRNAATSRWATRHAANICNRCLNCL